MHTIQTSYKDEYDLDLEVEGSLIILEADVQLYLDKSYKGLIHA